MLLLGARNVEVESKVKKSFGRDCGNSRGNVVTTAM